MKKKQQYRCNEYIAALNKRSERLAVNEWSCESLCINIMRGNEINTVIEVDVSNIRLVLEGTIHNRLPTDHDVYSRGIIFYLL